MAHDRRRIAFDGVPGPCETARRIWFTVVR